MTRGARPATPAALVADGTFEHAFALDQPGEAWAALTLAAPGTSWGRGVIAVVALDVDGRARQELILAGGDEPTEYLRLLGHLGAGPHLLRLGIHRDLSTSDVRTVTVSAVRTGSVGDTDPTAPIWQHAPVLHYRAQSAAPGGLTTDTPLLMFYRIVPDLTGDAIEYHVVYSHEDEGTDLTGLLARWGHTTDIEWVYRVARDGSGQVAREEFQGSGHRALPYRGGRALGRHPILQVATLNGLVSDRAACPHRVALAPACAQPPGEPREGVLQQFPWILRVSALEVTRQETLEDEPSPESPAPADLRCYVFLQWKRLGGPAVPLEAAVRVGGAWRPSGWGRPDLAFQGPDGESTAVKCARGTTEKDITGIAVRALEASEAPVELRLVRAFLLDSQYRPRPPLAAGGHCRLTAARPRAVVWERR